MPKRLRSVWISHKMTPLFGLNLAGYESDRAGIAAELSAAEASFQDPTHGIILVALDLAFCDLTPEVAAFLAAHPGGPGDCIHKLAIVGVPGWKRWWAGVTGKIRWPERARFFMEQEQAKAWLIAEY